MLINYLNYLWIAVAVLCFSVCCLLLSDWYSSRLLSDKRRTDTKSAPHADAQTTVRLLPVVHENPLQWSALCSVGIIQEYYTTYTEPPYNTYSDYSWLIIKHTCKLYLFPEGFANVGVVICDITCHHDTIIGQSQRHAQSVVTCIYTCKCNEKALRSTQKMKTDREISLLKLQIAYCFCSLCVYMQLGNGITVNSLQQLEFLNFIMCIRNLVSVIRLGD